MHLPSLLVLAFGRAAEDLKPIKDAGPYVPSPQSVVADMLRYADVGANDFLIDLGSGDGRIVLTAAKVFGARGFGVEIKDELVKKSNEAAKNEGLADRVKFMKQDLFKTDMSQATVITMYLLPDTVNLLKDKFLTELKPGTRIVSHDYPLTGWIPEKYVQMDLEDKVQISGVTTTLIYLYVVPAKVAGNWSAQMPPAVSKAPATLSLRQQLTRVSGSAAPRRQGRPARGREAARRPAHASSSPAARASSAARSRATRSRARSSGAKTPWSATLGMS